MEPANASAGARSSTLTDLLKSSRAGSPDAFEQLMPLVYDELRAIAHRQLRAERPDHTLGTTALVHEAYLRLVDQTRVDWQDRAHFFALAAHAMRRVLVDYARRRNAQKRGAAPVQVSLDDAVLAVDEQAELVMAVDEALTRLAHLDERQCRIVECRYFAGLTEQETAETLGLSERTIRNEWKKAKAWLYQQFTPSS